MSLRILLSIPLLMMVLLIKAQNNQVSSLGLATLSSSTNDSKVFVFNNDRDTLYLTPLVVNKHFLIQLDTSNYKAGLDGNGVVNLTTTSDQISIVDSVDVNHDGVKELILLRNYNNYSCPPDAGPCGVGCKQHTIQQYEVGDIQQKKNLFTVKNVDKAQVAITTNVMRSFGYRFQVEIKNGEFELSGASGDLAPLEMGTYQFKKGQYRLK